MKINEIIVEGITNYLGGFGQALNKMSWANGGSEKYYADKRAKALAKAKADVKTAAQNQDQQPIDTPEPVQTTQPQAQPEKLSIDQRRARRSKSMQRSPQERLQAVQNGDIIEFPGVGDITYDHYRNKWVDPTGEDVVIKNDVDKLNQRRDLMRRKSYLSQMDQPGTAT